jgi:GPH family glycoside/pentoside/hexuronide:cation symporter
MSSTAEPVNHPATPETGQVGLGEKLAYGSGNFAAQMVFNPATAFMVFFYTDVAGIAAGVVGTMLLFSRFFDLLNPVMGMVVDRTHTRWGKARPWLLWMAVPFGLSAVLLFTVPNIGLQGRTIYAFITYNIVFSVIYTMQDTPYASLGALMTPDSHQRALINIWRMILANSGIIFSFMITLPLVAAMGGGAAGWQRAFICFGALATVLMLVCFRFTKERIKPVRTQAAVPVKVGLKAMATNGYMILIMLLGVCLFITLGLYGANVYFCRYFLHDAERLGPLMTIQIAAQIAGMAVVGPIIKKFGKRNSTMAGLAISILGQLIMYIAPTSYLIVSIGTVVKGLGAAPMVGTMFAMVADTIDYGEWRSGFRTDGLTFGCFALMFKMSAGFGGAITGWVLGLGGYVAGAATQPASAMAAIRVLFLHIPLALYIVAGLIMWAYGLDGKYKKIHAELAVRRAAAQSS